MVYYALCVCCLFLAACGLQTASPPGYAYAPRISINSGI